MSPKKDDALAKWRAYNGLFFDDSRSNFSGCGDCSCLHTVVVSKGNNFRFSQHPPALFARNTELGDKMREYADMLRVDAGISVTDLASLVILYESDQFPAFLFLDWDQTISSATGLFTDNQEWFRELRAIDAKASTSAMGLIFGDEAGKRLRLVVKLLNAVMRRVRAKQLRFHIVTNQSDASAIESMLRELRAHWSLTPTKILVTGLKERRNLDKCDYIQVAMNKGHEQCSKTTCDNS